MRNEALQRLEWLTGEWHATMRDAWFLEPADRVVPGTARGEWLGDAFLLFRWTIQADVGPATNEMTLVIGRSDPHGAYTALYHDERGTNREFAVTFEDSR